MQCRASDLGGHLLFSILNEQQYVAERIKVSHIIESMESEFDT